MRSSGLPGLKQPTISHFPHGAHLDVPMLVSPLYSLQEAVEMDGQKPRLSVTKAEQPTSMFRDKGRQTPSYDQ